MNRSQQPLGGQIIDLQPMHSHRALTGKYRRNGKLQYAFALVPPRLLSFTLVPSHTYASLHSGDTAGSSLDSLRRVVHTLG
ncbi:uncharacterized protein F4817DRAFT_337521, partial [Daldinia loculata]|uniref:uncharacterized protein n=1 Tax=Daldinia loculata TaxID=103429 RepID=UPI0020C3E0B8